MIHPSLIFCASAINAIAAAAEQAGIVPGAVPDFGSGAGRVTRWLHAALTRQLLPRLSPKGILVMQFRKRFDRGASAGSRPRGRLYSWAATSSGMSKLCVTFCTSSSSSSISTRRISFCAA